MTDHRWTVLLLAKARRLRTGWIELHPDGQLFFMENLAGQQQQALKAIAKQRLP